MRIIASLIVLVLSCGCAKDVFLSEASSHERETPPPHSGTFAVPLSDSTEAWIVPDAEKLARLENFFDPVQFQETVSRRIRSELARNPEADIEGPDIEGIVFHRVYVRLMSGEHRSAPLRVGEYATVTVRERRGPGEE